MNRKTSEFANAFVFVYEEAIAAMIYTWADNY